MKKNGNRPHNLIRVSCLAATGALLLTGMSTTALADGLGSKKWEPATQLLSTDGTQVAGGCPIESPSGRFVFTARRPPSGTTADDLELFASERASASEAFSPGDALPGPVNDPLANDFCPTPLPDNELFFVSTREGCGGGDMFSAVQNPATGWSEPVNLGCDPEGPNTPGTEFAPSVIETVWGTFLYFSTDHYTGNQDIYRSRLRADGTFGPGVRLPWPINTMYDDRQPNVSQDGKEIVFASNRPSFEGDATGFDIFSARRGSLISRWRRVVNLSETVPFDSVDGSETRPSLSWDGKRLYYGSGGVWISERGR